VALQLCDDPIAPLDFSPRVFCKAEKGEVFRPNANIRATLEGRPFSRADMRPRRDHGIDRAIPAKSHNRETVWHDWHCVDDEKAMNAFAISTRPDMRPVRLCTTLQVLALSRQALGLEAEVSRRQLGLSSSASPPPE
jgi:hypothetical protein